MPSPNSDRNLLFGILAVQMDFITKDALIEAMHAWVLDKAKPIGQILLNQNALASDTHQLLEALVKKHLDLHDNDAEKSLAAVSSLGSNREALKQVADPDLSASLAHAASARQKDDPFATRDLSVGRPTSTGQRFRILRPHAKGGLGEVFVAEDNELRREVALKEIQNEHADDPQSRARFLLEAEITGGLEHPGIVPVYGLGQYGDGRPFYAMRFIKGDNLKNAIDRFHKAEGPKRDPGERALEFRKLLRRFHDVCNAVAYAHSRGVLHRDLKPGNIMLGQYGETLVVDWGLAKALNECDPGDTKAERPIRPTLGSGSEPTRMGAAIGSPQYMSPEQASGRLDLLCARSDVYGLGATLYCLLTGEPPVQGAEVGEVLSKVRTGDFPTAKKLKPDVPASLDAVCKKAMALDLEDRYGSPAELAADVEAWLADEAVRAWKEPLSVRASRWIRRHRLLVSGSAVALAASVLFFAILTAVLIYKKGEMAQEQLKTQAALAAEAERRKQVREALDEMSSTMIEDLLAKQVELTPQHRSFLEKARGYYEAFAEDTGKDEETLAGVADANLRVGNIQSKLETSKDAEKSYQRAIQLYQELCSEFPDAFQYRQKLALVHNNLANVLTRQNRLDEALVSYQEALAIRKVLANDFPDKHGTRLELVITYNNLGRLLGIKGHNDETEAIHREALSVIEKLSGEHPEIPNYRFHFANTYTFLAYFLRNNGKAIPAEEAYRRSILILDNLSIEFPKVRDYREALALGYNNLGELLEIQNQFDKSEEMIRKAISIQERLVVESAGLPSYRQSLVGYLYYLGFMLKHQGQYVQAQEAQRRALIIQELLATGFKDIPHYQQVLADIHSELADILMLRGELKEAELECQKALPLREGLLEKHPDVLRYKVDLARCQNDVAYFLAEQGKEFQAEATYNKALTHFRELVRVNPYLPEFKSSLAETLNDMGLLCMKKNTRIAQAEKFFLEALGIREWLSQNHSNVGYYVVDLGATHANLGHLHMDKSDFPEAQKELGKGIEILQACLASEPRQPRARRFLRKAHSDRARLYDRLGEYIAAIHDWDHALEVDDGPGKAEIRAFKALSLARAGDLTAAEAEANEVASHTSDVEILVTAARVYGVMSGMSGTSSAKAEPHAVKAVALLQRAIQAGYKNLSVLRRDSDLDSLRKRDDFRKVLSSLESMK